MWNLCQDQGFCFAFLVDVKCSTIWIFWKGYVSYTNLFLYLCQKLICHVCVAFISGFCILPYWLIHLPLYHYHLILISYVINNKQSFGLILILLFFKIALTILVPFHFHFHFRIILSLSTKYHSGVNRNSHYIWESV